MESPQPLLTKLKTIAGWALFLGGALMLNGRLDGLWNHMQALTEQFGAGAIGFLPAFGLASLQATHTFLYERTAFLSALGQTLLSCWPVVLLLVGAALMYSTPGSLKKASAMAKMSNRSNRGNR
jgi:hypothetical protein